MPKRVLGIYSTVEETRDAVDVFELRGHESKNVVIFADNINQAQFKDHQIVNLHPTQHLHEEEGFIEKIIDNLPTAEVPKFSTTNKLIEYGLSETEATKALSAVRNGNIVVIVDDELRMGHV